MADFESLYTNIPVEAAIKTMVFMFQNVIENTQFIIELLEKVLKNSIVSFHSEYFQHIFGIITVQICTNFSKFIPCHSKRRAKKEIQT